MEISYRVIKIVTNGCTGISKYYTIDVYSKWSDINSANNEMERIKQKYPYDKFQIQHKIQHDNRIELSLMNNISYVTELNERIERDNNFEIECNTVKSETVDKEKNNKIIDEMRRENPNW